MVSPLDELLKFWRTIYAEGIEFCDLIAKIPDACGCKDADAHLEGRCRCCQSKGAERKDNARGENCTAILARLRADASLFGEDFGRLATPLAGLSGGIELRRGVFLTADDLQHILETIEGVDKAVVGFRLTCDVAELHGLKFRGGELREHLINLNDLFERRFVPD